MMVFYKDAIYLNSYSVWSSMRTLFNWCLLRFPWLCKHIRDIVTILFFTEIKFRKPPKCVQKRWKLFIPQKKIRAHWHQENSLISYLILWKWCNGLAINSFEDLKKKTEQNANYFTSTIRKESKRSETEHSNVLNERMRESAISYK